MLDETLHGIAIGIEIVAVAVIVIGTVSASWIFLRSRMSGAVWSEAFHDYRTNLGRGILIGLELLVAGDIVDTVAVEGSLGRSPTGVERL